VTAVSKSLRQSPDNQTQVDEDGGLYVTHEALTRFGGGDARIGRKELRAMLAAEREGVLYSGPTENPKTVRVAGPSDEADILELLKLDLADNAAHICPIDEEKVLSHIQVGTRRRGGFVGVIGKPAVAVVILIPRQWWWGNGWFFEELVNFVHPDHRKSNHASDLIDFAKWASDFQTRGYGYRVWLLCGVLGGWRVHSKIKLFRRKACQVGAFFLYPSPPMRGN
jgi:hypothetical protein